MSFFKCAPLELSCTSVHASSNPSFSLSHAFTRFLLMPSVCPISTLLQFQGNLTVTGCSGKTFNFASNYRTVLINFLLLFISSPLTLQKWMFCTRRDLRFKWVRRQAEKWYRGSALKTAFVRQLNKAWLLLRCVHTLNRWNHWRLQNHIVGR